MKEQVASKLKIVSCKKKDKKVTNNNLCLASLNWIGSMSSEIDELFVLSVEASTIVSGVSLCGLVSLLPKPSKLAILTFFVTSCKCACEWRGT